MSSTSNTRILIIEDDEDDFFITKTLLRRARSMTADVTWKRTFEDGIEAMIEEPFDVILVDYRLGAHTGLDVLDRAHDAGVTVPIILLTGQGDLEVDIRAMERGAADYLVKGSIDELLLERSIRYARERADQAARIREQAGLLDKAKDAICVYAIDRTPTYANTSADQLRDVRASGTVLFAFVDEDEQKAWATTIAEGEWSGEIDIDTGNGVRRIVDSRWTLVRDAQGEPQSILTISSDISERKQLESQFLRSQRMESIGRLVGGIAHDLGNLLVPIVLGVRVLEKAVQDQPRAIRTLEMIKKSAERGSDMVRQVLAFARGVEGERVVLQPSDVIRETGKILDETFPGHHRGHDQRRRRPVARRRRCDAASAGAHEPERQRPRRHAQRRQTVHRRAQYADRPALRTDQPGCQTRSLRSHHRHGHRRRHSTRRDRQGVRAVFHHQRTQQRHRPRPVDRL